MEINFKKLKNEDEKWRRKNKEFLSLSKIKPFPCRYLILTPLSICRGVKILVSWLPLSGISDIQNSSSFANVGYTRHGFSEKYIDQFFWISEKLAVKFYLAENTQTDDCVTKNCLFGYFFSSYCTHSKSWGKKCQIPAIGNDFF